MEIRFNVTKDERKALVGAVGEIAGWKPIYKGAPSFAFAIANYIIDRYARLVHALCEMAKKQKRVMMKEKPNAGNDSYRFAINSLWYAPTF